MPNFLKKLEMGKHILIIYMVSFFMLALLIYYNWIIGLVAAVLIGLSFYYSMLKEREREDETEAYISTLSYRVKKVGEEALLGMPIGILLYSEEMEVEWANPFLNQLNDDETLVGNKIDTLQEDLSTFIKEDKETFLIPIQETVFEVFHKKEDRLLYFFDRTEKEHFKLLYHNQHPVLGTIYLDNYDEITQNMDDTARSQINSEVTSILNEWSHKQCNE